MKKLMILSALASSLFLGSCGNNDDEIILHDDTALENPQAPRAGQLDGSDDSGPTFSSAKKWD